MGPLLREGAHCFIWQEVNWLRLLVPGPEYADPVAGAEIGSGLGESAKVQLNNLRVVG